MKTRRVASWDSPRYSDWAVGSFSISPRKPAATATTTRTASRQACSSAGDALAAVFHGDEVFFFANAKKAARFPGPLPSIPALGTSVLGALVGHLVTTGGDRERGAG